MWSTDTFSHVRGAAAVLDERVRQLHALLALGPDVADPEAVREAGLAVEDAMECFWAPVAWDHDPDPVRA